MSTYSTGVATAKSADSTHEEIQTWINLHQAIRVIEARLEERLKAEVDLSWADFETLMRLRISAGHPMQMSEMATQLVGSPSGTTRIADRLERAGLIERETPRDNRRIVLVQLTESGRRLLAKAERVFRAALEESFGKHLSHDDVMQLRQLMRQLLEGNGAWQEARCSPPL
jgi:DNA-binding MarR family transcriptional regulator